MMSAHSSPNYPHENIASPHALAEHLRIELNELLYVAENAEKFYRRGPRQPKKGGGFRETHDAEPRLKIIHERIKNKLLKEVKFPDYIQGGIAVPEKPRSYITNAQQHSGKTIIIAEDIASFYPSTNKKIVFSVWTSFFQFTKDVAELLTKLTTHEEQLPQGWKTSGYIANLAFFRLEPLLVERLQKQGLVYTRYIDDITISSKRPLSTIEKRNIIASIYGMLLSLDYSPKRSKQEILTKGRQSMKVMNLNTTGTSARLAKAERRKIRAIVHNLANRAIGNSDEQAFIADWNSASGKVARLTALHPKEGKRLREKLRSIKP